MENICKSFGSVQALKNASVEILKGEVHCLLGENGAGKSTLMNALYGLYPADSGSIFINGSEVEINKTSTAQSLQIGMVHQHFMLIESMSVLKNIVLGDEEGRGSIDYSACRKRIAEIAGLYHFDFDLDKTISELSVGEKQRVEIFKAIYRGADIIILDEPTAVLTPPEVEVLFKVLGDMKSQGKTIIFITHKLAETMALSDRVTVLRSGEVITTVETAGETPQSLANLMVGHAVDLELKKSESKPGAPVLEIHGIRLFPSAEGPVDLTIREGEIFGIAGVDGNGQSELESMIAGTLDSESGEILYCGENIAGYSVEKRKSRGIGLIHSDRHRDSILPEMPLLRNFLLGYQKSPRFSQFGFLRGRALREYAEKMIKSYSIKTSSADQRISELSGGNQQKVVFSREAGMEPTLLVAAQPVRGLDVGAIDYIHNELLKLRDQGKAILLISTELKEVMELSDRIGVLYKGQISVQKDAGRFTAKELGYYMAGGTNFEE